MARTELIDLMEYWTKKYPNIHVSIYPHTEGQKYFGRMTTHSTSFDLSADTIGELISQGESFLRTVK
jgi:hypothetical protein